LAERDFFRDRLSEDDIRRLLAGRPAAELFSWKSPRAKAMGLSPEKPPPDDELMRLMAEEPYLIRRPIVVAGDRLIIGFDKKGIDEALG